MKASRGIFPSSIYRLLLLQNQREVFPPHPDSRPAPKAFHLLPKCRSHFSALLFQPITWKNILLLPFSRYWLKYFRILKLLSLTMVLQTEPFLSSNLSRPKNSSYFPAQRRRFASTKCRNEESPRPLYRFSGRGRLLVPRTFGAGG